jgi:hypothetical protein
MPTVNPGLDSAHFAAEDEERHVDEEGGEKMPIKIGDKIEHNLMPGFEMKVLDIEPCDPDCSGDSHSCYKVIDPEGKEDWLCEHDVKLVQ